MIFARKVPEFYIIIARKIFSPIFFGGRHVPPALPSPTPMRHACQMEFVSTEREVGSSWKKRDKINTNYTNYYINDLILNFVKDCRNDLLGNDLAFEKTTCRHVSALSLAISRTTHSLRQNTHFLKNFPSLALSLISSGLISRLSHCLLF